MNPSNPSRRPQGMMIDLEIGKAPAPSMPPAGRVRATGGRPAGLPMDPLASQASGHQEPDGDETGTIACPGCGQLYKLVPAGPEMQEEGQGMENEGGGAIQSPPLSGTPGV